MHKIMPVMIVSLISKFDPWRSALCTCPPKLTLNPYTGCQHACVYCYASTYIPRFFNCRPKKNLVSRLEREAAKLTGETISIANSSDPYPSLEARTRLTRSCLIILSRHNCKIQIVTKSSLVVRDAELLSKIHSMVSLTITTDDDTTARLIEPNAPSSSERLKAAETLIAKGIPTSVRIDPVIPLLNDEPESLIKKLASIGVKHITSSTLKIRPGNWTRFSAALPETAEKLGALYFKEGEKMGNYTYLPADLRFQLLKKVGCLAQKYGVKFGTCREGLGHLDTATCDGSWLLNT
jgi:DNA repair photolyase